MFNKKLSQLTVCCIFMFLVMMFAFIKLFYQLPSIIYFFNYLFIHLFTTG